MVSSKVTIRNATGLHMRPAGKLCDLALKYPCRIQLVSKKGNANAKSLLCVLGARIKYGDEIEIVCDGEREEQALEAMVQLIEYRL